MPTTRIHRLAVMAAAAAAGTGITYAATSTATVDGCTNSHNTLRLLSGHGKCSHGYHEAAIGRRGATGVKGVTGATGATGPGAITISATQVPSTVTRSIPGMGVDVEPICFADSANVNRYDTVGGTTGTTGTIEVNGASVQSADGHVVLGHNGASQIVPINSATISYRQTSISSGFSLTSGQFSTEPLVVRGGRSMALDISLGLQNGVCNAKAQATPAS